MLVLPRMLNIVNKSCSYQQIINYRQEQAKKSHVTVKTSIPYLANIVLIIVFSSSLIYLAPESRI